MKDMVGRFHPNIIILQESKLAEFSESSIRRLCQFANPGWFALPSIRAAEGILMLWDAELLKAESVWANSFSVSMVAYFKGETPKVDDNYVYMVLRGEDNGRRISLMNWMQFVPDGTSRGALREILMRSYSITSAIDQQGHERWTSSVILLIRTTLSMCLCRERNSLS